MTPGEVGAHAESLAGVKRKGTTTRPGWYVDDRLVARLADPTTLVVRVPLTEREALLEAHPRTFGVPPRMESHHKVEVYLDRADPAAVRRALELAWNFQRRS
ncbi:MmcQ/YjbR family DNA-binding protein [Nocardioides marmoribigeumensis]|jgi:hypothetical protein|uniref:MmcQ/YjbR family DNA-binding protein n=1 Tax=Nocardioides marmoribigeumensis TaxID=433649 RepID=A0ABU2BU82_9ACTN|nr:hypothetical protein [Nocardioides marmoribigeumensis]MDR7362184.1 hypothetical protein [Nocardioides marmoribigeumensis]